MGPKSMPFAGFTADEQPETGGDRCSCGKFFKMNSGFLIGVNPGSTPVCPSCAKMKFDSEPAFATLSGGSRGQFRRFEKCFN